MGSENVDGGRESPLEPAYLVLIDVLLDKPVVWELKKKHVTIGVSPESDVGLPNYGMERVVRDERYLPEFTLRYCDKYRRWLIQRRFDQIQFHPAIRKRWFRSPDEMDQAFSAQRSQGSALSNQNAVAPEGLVMCMLNPDSTAFVDHGDCFEFTLAVSVIRFNLRFLFWAPCLGRETVDDVHAKAEVGLTTVADEARAREDGRTAEHDPPTLETMPDLVLAHIASFLTPSEYLESLQMACPSITQRLRGRVHWPRVDLCDSLDTIRLGRMALASKVSAVSCVHLRAPEDVEACPLFYESVKKLIEGEALRELKVSQVSVLSKLTSSALLPQNLRKVTFVSESQTGGGGTSWLRDFDAIAFPRSVASVSYTAHAAYSPCYSAWKARLFDAFPACTRFSFYPSPNSDFWDCVEDETVARITDFHTELRLKSEFPIDRMDNLKRLRVHVADRLAVITEVFYFTLVPSLEALSINPLAIGTGADEFWSSLAERAPNLRHLELFCLPGEFEMARSHRCPAGDDVGLVEALRRYLPRTVTTLVLKDVRVSINGLVRLARELKELTFFEATTTTNLVPVPSEIRPTEGVKEFVTWEWLRNGHWPHQECKLSFVFSLVPESEMREIRQVFDV